MGPNLLLGLRRACVRSVLKVSSPKIGIGDISILVVAYLLVANHTQNMPNGEIPMFVSWPTSGLANVRRSLDGCSLLGGWSAYISHSSKP